MLSITHRGTGCLLAAYVVGAGLAGISGDCSIVSSIEAMQLGAASLAAIKFSIAFPFSYHLVNGIRHLFWDMGKFLSIKEVYTTGYAMIFVSTLLSLALTFGL
jgi:succinate dehydrogenase (ubiquinone) cytochrome b560 subunit